MERQQTYGIKKTTRLKEVMGYRKWIYGMLVIVRTLIQEIITRSLFAGFGTR